MDKKREQGPGGVVQLGKYILSDLETQGLVPNTACKLDMAMWCDCITITEIILALVGWLVGVKISCSLYWPQALY